VHDPPNIVGKQVVVFWVMVSYTDVVGYQYFGWSCYLHPDPVITQKTTTWIFIVVKVSNLAYLLKCSWTYICWIFLIFWSPVFITHCSLKNRQA